MEKLRFFGPIAVLGIVCALLLSVATGQAERTLPLVLSDNLLIIAAIFALLAFAAIFYELSRD